MSSSMPTPPITELLDPTRPNHVILFGDSITEWSFENSPNHTGFGYRLTHYYKDLAQVLNRGVAAYTTTWLKPYFHQILGEIRVKATKPPLLFTIFLGANDAAPPGGPQHVPLDQFEANIREFVDTILNDSVTKGTKILLIAVTPIALPTAKTDSDDSDRDDQVEERRGNEGYKTYMRKKQYAEATMRIAKEYEAKGKDVVGLNAWRDFVNSAMRRGLGEPGTETKVEEYDDDTLAGSGLPTAWEFQEGWFVDGIHLGPQVWS
ncbi:MAG: hypothetical protein M1820_008168 [Bogoriella megaspora]|nr:MAG: hypothetical protein M1820_008168 [Bogoriella megaspora]